MFAGTSLVDVLVFPERGCTNSVQLAISPTSETIKIVAKTQSAKPVSVGSVSFRPQLILDGGAAVHRMWVTLFEHQDDDEYDGMMGLHDEEEPCVLMDFEVAQELAPNFKSSSELSLKATSQRLHSPTPLQQIDNRGPIAYHSVETKKMPVLSHINSEPPQSLN